MKISRNTSLLYIGLLFLLLAGSLSACGSLNSQRKDDGAVTIGIVNQIVILDTVIEGYRTGMAEQGYIEGENVTYIYNGPISEIEGLETEVQSMLDVNVDLIVSLGTPTTQVAQRVTAGTDVPVVFMAVTDPVASGIVENLSAPGGNLTGIMLGQSGVKELERLKNFVPEVVRVFVPYDPNNQGPSLMVEQIRESAPEMGIEIVVAETPDRETVLAELEALPEDIDAILVIPDGTVGEAFEDILTVSQERHIPVAASNAEQLAMGALLSLGVDFSEMGRQGARLGAQVLNGIPVGELPVEVAEYYLMVNLPVAETLGITIDDSLLVLADEIIK